MDDPRRKSARCCRRSDEGRGDRPRVGPEGVPSPSYRQLLATRWRWGALGLRSTLPAVAGLLGAAAAWADEHWGESAGSVGPYPAFAQDE